MTEQQTAAMRQALEALELEDMACRYEKEPTPEHIANAITALRQALEQAEQEPVAWMYVNKDGECEQIEYGEPFNDPSVTPLYTVPVRTKDLTDEDKLALWKKWNMTAAQIDAVIAKYKEKNNANNNT